MPRSGRAGPRLCEEVPRAWPEDRSQRCVSWYPRFCASPQTTDPEQHARSPLDDLASWLHALERALCSAASATLPILARFTSKPFLALVAQGDPTDLERALDPHYFMASTELNLLNTLLLAAPER